MSKNWILLSATLLVLVFARGVGAIESFDITKQEEKNLVLIQKVSDKHNLGYLFPAVIAVESSFCTVKTGTLDPYGYGCGQIHHKTAAKMRGKPVSIKALRTNDALNLELSARYLSYCLRWMPSIQRGLECYKEGPFIALTMKQSDLNDDDYPWHVLQWLAVLMSRNPTASGRHPQPLSWQPALPMLNPAFHPPLYRSPIAQVRLSYLQI